MNAIQKAYGPFAHSPVFRGQKYVMTCDQQSRIALVRTSNDVEWLQAVIKYRHSQKTVKDAARRRLKWVNKAVDALIADYKKREVKP